MSKRAQTTAGMVLLKVCSILTITVFIVPAAALLSGSIRFVLSKQLSVLNLISKALPFFGATLTTSLIAILICAPFSLLFAVYTVDYASSDKKQRYTAMFKTLMDIPTVVLGLFALQFIVPMGTKSLWAASLALALFITPFITGKLIFTLEKSLNRYRHTALSLGVTQREALWKMVLPHSFGKITAAVALGFSRAAGEAIIVGMIQLKPQTMAGTMVAGLTDADRLSVLGLMLFIFILTLHIVHRREQ